MQQMRFVLSYTLNKNVFSLFLDVSSDMSGVHMSVYRTAAFLMRHLAHIAMQDAKTGMHCKNLAIVWAPNLLKFVYSEYLLYISCIYCYFTANNNNIQQHCTFLCCQNLEVVNNSSSW